VLHVEWTTGDGFVLAGSEVTAFGYNTAHHNERAGLLHTPDPTGDECPLLQHAGVLGGEAGGLLGAEGLTMMGNGEAQICAAMPTLGLLYTQVSLFLCHIQLLCLHWNPTSVRLAHARLHICFISELPRFLLFDCVDL
jgi:hypothetical protein